MPFDPEIHHINMTVGEGWQQCYTFKGAEHGRYQITAGDARGPCLYLAKNFNPSYPEDKGYAPTTQEMAVVLAFLLYFEQKDWGPVCEIVCRAVAAQVKDQKEAAEIYDRLIRIGISMRREINTVLAT